MDTLIQQATAVARSQPTSPPRATSTLSLPANGPSYAEVLQHDRIMMALLLTGIIFANFVVPLLYIIFQCVKGRRKN